MINLFPQSSRYIQISHFLLKIEININDQLCKPGHDVGICFLVSITGRHGINYGHVISVLLSQDCFCNVEIQIGNVQLNVGISVNCLVSVSLFDSARHGWGRSLGAIDSQCGNSRGRLVRQATTEQQVDGKEAANQPGTTVNKRMNEAAMRLVDVNNQQQ